MLAKGLGVPQADQLDPVLEAFVDSAAVDNPLRTLITKVTGMYAWNCQVAADIMNPDPTPLTEHLIAMPGSAYVVKDTGSSGIESVWVAIADPPSDVFEAFKRMPCRGLIQTFKVSEGDFATAIAIQLSSCLK